MFKDDNPPLEEKLLNNVELPDINDSINRWNQHYNEGWSVINEHTRELYHFSALEIR